MRKIQDQVNLKADRTELEELEKLLMIRFNDIITALTLKFADKAETKKALKLLEFMSKTETSNKDDAMFSKIGYSCASCEKNLTNLQG